jgi:hypothetical protein
MKNLKTLLSIVAALVLLFSLAVPVAFADEDTVSGSFTPGNVTPTVTALGLYSDSECADPVTSMNPQTMYYVKVTAGDNNDIDDIEEIEVQLFYNATPSDPDAPGSPDTQTCAIFTWTKAGDTWTVSAGTGSSWAITSGSCSTPSSMTETSGDWVFAITPGKVATESPGSDNWDMYAKATDGSGSGDMYERDKQMLWYGEISTSATAPFGEVTLGVDFADGTNEVTGVSVTYTCNGAHAQKVKSDATWTTGGSNNATFDANGDCDDPQEFSLMADEADTFGSAVQVDTTGVSINTGAQTGETGTEVATNTLWLKAASVFSNDTYSGNITYIIANND